MNIVGLLPLLLIFVLLYFVMIKPAKKRQQQAAQTQGSLRPGMEVRTIAGLYATVSEIEDDSVILEIAPGVHCRYIKSAIAAVLSTDTDDESAEDDTEAGDETEHAAQDDTVPAAGLDAGSDTAASAKGATKTVGLNGAKHDGAPLNGTSGQVSLGKQLDGAPVATRDDAEPDTAGSTSLDEAAEEQPRKGGSRKDG